MGHRTDLRNEPRATVADSVVAPLWRTSGGSVAILSGGLPRRCIPALIHAAGPFSVGAVLAVAPRPAFLWRPAGRCGTAGYPTCPLCPQAGNLPQRGRRNWRKAGDPKRVTAESNGSTAGSRLSK